MPEQHVLPRRIGIPPSAHCTDHKELKSAPHRADFFVAAGHLRLRLRPAVQTCHPGLHLRLPPTPAAYACVRHSLLRFHLIHRLGLVSACVLLTLENNNIDTIIIAIPITSP